LPTIAVREHRNNKLGNHTHLWGYLGRATDPPPGHQLMWQGYTCLQMMCVGFALGLENSG
jgi:hypothetical protein